MKKKLSIITPLYNTQRRFLEDLVKCLSKYEKEIEWILINDSPNNEQLNTDIESIRQPYMKVYSNDKNRGIFYSYYQGFMKASGEFCCIVDHDDIFDPSNVLHKLDEDPDLLYTDEFKFDDTGYREVYRKPEFDILSSIFYFYTHHVTVMRTLVIQKMLERKGNTGVYTSIFDIHMMLEYMNYYIGKDIKVVHIDSADYGWRIHALSTAKSLDQKLSGYFEREQKVEEFLFEHGEIPLLNIHQEIGYLIEGFFMSMHDEYKTALTNEKFCEQLIQFRKENDTIFCNLTEESIRTNKRYFFDVLYRIPFNVVKDMGIETCYLPEPQMCKVLGGDSYVRHVVDVPFIKMYKKEDLNPEVNKGLWFAVNQNIKNSSKIACIMMKASAEVERNTK